MDVEHSINTATDLIEFIIDTISRAGGFKRKIVVSNENSDDSSDDENDNYYIDSNNDGDDDNGLPWDVINKLSINLKKYRNNQVELSIEGSNLKKSISINSTTLHGSIISLESSGLKDSTIDNDEGWD